VNVKIGDVFNLFDYTLVNKKIELLELINIIFFLFEYRKKVMYENPCFFNISRIKS
jgi:hypothetical protein